MFGFIFQKSGEVVILAEVQWLSEWGLRGSWGLLWTASILYCKWDQEHSLGELRPFAFSFPLLCPAFSYLPKQWAVGLWPRSGLSVRLPVLAFLIPAVRTKGTTLLSEPWPYFPPPSTKLIAYSFPNAGEGISQAIPQFRLQHSVWQVVRSNNYLLIQ